MEMQIKTTFHFTPVRRAIMKKTNNNKCWRDGMEKEPLYTVGGNVKYCSHCGNQYGASSKNYYTI
jgi:pyruvate-formate lyase